jgi:hypothetical protein
MMGESTNLSYAASRMQDAEYLCCSYSRHITYMLIIINIYCSLLPAGYNERLQQWYSLCKIFLFSFGSYILASFKIDYSHGTVTNKSTQTPHARKDLRGTKWTFRSCHSKVQNIDTKEKLTSAGKWEVAYNEAWVSERGEAEAVQLTALHSNSVWSCERWVE